MKKEIFIVPNNDLEAKTIIDLLKKHNRDVLVTSQTWGASWEQLEESIKEKIKNYKKVYGVELQGNAPSNGINIDHHIYGADNRSSEKSSLEQVAELLNTELTVWEQFISANDKGYIPAMKSLGQQLKLSNNEIERMIIEVRALDRKQQGISEEQERQAVEAIEKLDIDHTKIPQNLIIVHLPHSKCATVTDRLFGLYKNLLILSEDGETNFYGVISIINELKNKFDGWSGGELEKGNGYWGSNTANQKEVEEFVRNFIFKSPRIPPLL